MKKFNNKKAKKGYTNLSAELPVELHQKFHALAKQQERSASGLLRILISNYVEKHYVEEED